MIETIKGSVQRIVFENSQTGYKVLRVRMPTGPSVSMQGEFGPDMVVGTIADFHGQYKTHPKYGTGFKVSTYDIMHDAEENASIKLYIDLIAPHIGPERADLIVNYFGDDIIEVLDDWPERLVEVEGIGRVSADSLAKAWKENREKWDEMRQEFTLRAFLNALGIKERRVKRILSHFGGGVMAEVSIKENPYVLAEIEGFGFSTADFVAKQLGTPENSPMRLRAFLFYSLMVTCPSNGHMFYTHLELAKLVNTYCTEHNTKFIDKDRILVEDIEPVIKEMAEEKKVILEADAVYNIKGFGFESRSAALLTEMMETPSDLILINREYIDEHIKTFERESGLTLSEEQRNALYYFLEKKVFVITGAPGTGKTTVLKAVVSLIKHLRLGLTCLTPTGISAKKMASTIDFEASTIHRALGFRGNDWVYGESNKFETDVVIVDETSMVDQEVFYRLLAALKNRVHLIFVGDENQLPSVGSGNVLRELINSNQVPLVRLEQIFRQAEASDIIKVAHKIKNGDTDLSLFKPDPTADVFFMREKDLARMEQIVVKLAQRFKDERRQFQIITPKNDGPLSVSMLNKVLQEILNPPSDELTQIQCGDYVLRKGDRIRVKKNDYENLIYNGDIGKVINIAGGYVTIDVDGRHVQLSVDELDEKIKLAYSISVHGSQGHEYQYVILPFINQYGKMLLQRNLLYTAITRAKIKVIVIGHGSALERAINNSSVYLRNTKLGERIYQCLLKRRSNSSLPLPPAPPAPPTVPSSKEQFLSLEAALSAVGITG